MREPTDWDETDLEALIAAQTSEHISLDYKACDALQKTDGRKLELSKDVSALANGAGGVLVYGIKEDANHIATSLDVGFQPTDITKEWIEQVINSTIQRRIDGIRIRPIVLARNSPGKVAYVIVVPQSSRAPHMAHDGRYYKRFNFLSTRMEEYEVRDVARRTESPKLSMRIVQRNGPNERLTYPNQHDSHSRLINVGVEVFNESFEPTDHALLAIFVDARVVLPLATGGRYAGRVQKVAWEVGDRALKVTKVEFTAWGVSERVPLFQGVNFPVDEVSICLPRIGLEGAVFALGWLARAPRMEERHGFQLMRAELDHATLDEKQMSGDELLPFASLPWR